MMFLFNKKDISLLVFLLDLISLNFFLELQ